MKKALIISGMALVLSTAFASPSLYAGGTKKSKDAASKVMAAFSLKFPNAMEIKWDMSRGVCNALFTLQQDKVRAQFSKRGHLMFTYRYHHDTGLPPDISRKMGTQYRDFKVENVTEYTDPRQHIYFVLLKNKAQWIWLAIGDKIEEPVVYEEFSEPT